MYLLFGAAAFLYLAFIAHSVPFFPWDLSITLWAQSVTHSGVERLMVWVSVPGDGSWRPYVVATVFYSILLLAGKRHEAECGLMSVWGGVLLNSFFKWVVARPRPSLDLVRVWAVIDNGSFPSGHVVHYMTFYGFLCCLASGFMTNRSSRTFSQLFLTTLIVLVGPSRIYLGAHWASDVLGGYLLGGLWLRFSVQVYRRQFPWNNNGTIKRHGPDGTSDHHSDHGFRT
jgi:undecaprenyl-diphosphatase